MDLIEANDRLVDITANYVPDVYTNRDGIDVQIDNYLILSINPVNAPTPDHHAPALTGWGLFYCTGSTVRRPLPIQL